MRYQPLVELSLRHPAAAAGTLPAAMIVPDPPTQARIDGQRCRLARVGDRLVLLAEIDADGAPLVPIDPPLRLGFTISPLPLPLAAATDGEALAAAPLFTDEGAGRAMLLPLVAVADDDVARGEAAPGGGPRIRIRLTEAAIRAALAGKVRRCVATLPALSARWCFHVVTDLDAPLADWRIARADGDAGQAPGFGANAVAEVAANDADDPAGAALAAACPGRRVLRFLSDAPVPMSDAPVRGLELRVGATCLLGALPNPPPTAFARIGGETALARTLAVVTA